MNRITAAAKVIWLASWAALMTLVMFLPIMLAAICSSTGNLAFTLSRIWAWVILRVSGVRTRIVGRENIRAKQSYVIISNHQSLYDIPALVTRLGLQFRWVIKKELLKVPLFGYALHASRNIFIDRSNRAQAVESIRRGADRLPSGVSVMFFAEGTRSPDGRIQQFKKGPFFLALEKGFPILPVTVNGSSRVLPKNSFVFHPGVIEVVIGSPIHTRGYARDRIDSMIEKTRSLMQSNLSL